MKIGRKTLKEKMKKMMISETLVILKRKQQLKHQRLKNQNQNRKKPTNKRRIYKMMKMTMTLVISVKMKSLNK